MQSAMKRFVISIIISIIAGTPALRAETVTVFAATSLTESLREIATAYEKRTGDKIVFNFAASGPLVRQLEEGAPADIFFSADEAKMNDAGNKDLLVKSSRRSLLSNLLVVVAASDSTLALAGPKDLAAPGVKLVALGDPATVPAGTYAKAYLTKLGLWGDVGKKAVPCASVRAVLAAVESGNVDAGIVYKTDAAISKNVKVAFAVAAKDGPAISYPVALLREAPHPAAARKFIEHLAGQEAGMVFTRYGFILLQAVKME